METYPNNGPYNIMMSSFEKDIFGSNEELTNLYLSSLQVPNNGSSITIVRNNNANARDGISNRATSPSAVPSNIPTPGGKILSNRAPHSGLEKQPGRIPTLNTGQAIPSQSSKCAFQKTPAANKNSMLDKFKFFNKEKEKAKGSGIVKSPSRSSSGSSSNSASNLPQSRGEQETVSDNKSSSNSARGSSSMENGSLTIPTGSSSPKLSSKITKKGLGRTFNAKRDSAGLSTDDNTSKRSTPSPSPRTPSPNYSNQSAPTSRKISPPPGKKSSSGNLKSDRNESKRDDESNSSKKNSKITSLIPKSGAKAGKQPSPGSQIPPLSTGIPKPKGKSSSKEEKVKVPSAVRDHSKGGHTQLLAPSLSNRQSSKSSRQNLNIHQPPPPPLPDEGQLSQQLLSIPSDNVTAKDGYDSHIYRDGDPPCLVNSPTIRQVAAVQGQNIRCLSPTTMVGKTGIPGKSNSHYVEVTVPAVGYESERSSSHRHQQNRDKDLSCAERSDAISQSVNVVKPTRSLTPNSFPPVAKVDGNTQTNLSALQRQAIKKLDTVKENSLVGDDSQSQEHHLNSHCQNEGYPSHANNYEELIAAEKPTPSSTNSPRLGVKILSSQLAKPANNVAIVQPRHGEKIETTFDTEVRTETVSKSGKETLILEKDNKETTFIDDAGETMDIKPMPPIMRAMPYGYFRGYVGTSSNKNFHIPGISVPTSLYAGGGSGGGGSGSSRLSMNRSYMDQGGYYSSSSIKRAMSSGGQSALESDYASDLDTYDYISGYVSDGDILRSRGCDDMGSGYLSEGGASLYARRLQQRFREGMQAVKECMQKSSGILDYDRNSNAASWSPKSNATFSFDDSSSISSGDISDTIAEISTDENLTGGSNCSDSTNPYSSLKRTPKEGSRTMVNGTVPLTSKRFGIHGPGILSSDYQSPSHLVSSWRKYSLPQNKAYGGSDSGESAYVYSSFDHSHWRKPDGSVGPLRKLTSVSHSDLGISLHTSSSFCDSDRYSTKRDSETNTDQSCLMDASMKKVHQNGMNSSNNGNNSAMNVNNYGYRRPLSNASSSSVGSNKSNGSKDSVPGRMVKHGDRSSDGRNGGYEVPITSIPRPGSAPKPSGMSMSDVGPDAYSNSTLERRKKSGNHTPKSTTSSQTDSELYKSNTLGRKLLSSRNSMGNKNGEGLCNSTIISNPHATYSKHDSSGRPYTTHNPCHQSYSNYISLDYSSPRHSASANNPWLKNSNGNLSSVGGHSPMQMSETESMESISSTASSIQAQLQQARALSSASCRILAHQMAQNPNMGLHRSNSIRSTQSECLYSSNHHTISEDLTRTNSYSQVNSPHEQPSSPTPSNSSHSSSRFTYPMTAYNPSMLSQSYTQNMVRSNTQSSMPYSSLALSKISKEEDASLHGSSLSLVSTSSSIYSSAEEKHNQEIRKLRRELDSAQDKVSTLTTQLSTNAHVVAAFEQSLSNMTNRLQQLTASAEQKWPHHLPMDSELNELRATIEALKRQSGLNNPDSTISPNIGRRHTSPAAGGSEARIIRQMSSDSMSSINSLSSACSAASQQSAATDGDIGKKKNKKKGWLRSSFSKAFSRKKNKHGSMSDVEPDTTSLRSNCSAPNSPLLQLSHLNGPGSIKGSHSSGAICESEDSTVSELRKQLREKDMKLTDIRLEALTSAHQLEQLRETMNKMRNEMSALKADNDRLTRMVTTKNLNMSTSSLHHQVSNDSLDRSLSLASSDHGSLGRRKQKMGMKSPTQSDIMQIPETPDREGKRVTITVYLGSNPDPTRAPEKLPEVLIGSLSVSGKTKWDILDNIVRKIFKEYVLRIDPITNLGLSAESVFSYHIGEIIRTKDAEVPELLPIGYLVGDTMQIGICLKGTKQNSVDSLAFETQIPKSIIQRYVSLLLEHRRIILCGPSGTGKTYLAQKLAEHLVLRSGRELTAGSVATFNVDHKSGKELRQYLSNIAEQCESTSAGELPSVIILDNLHHVGSLGEVFNGFLSVKYQKCPYIIGTMNQATGLTTNLQLHHNFRWVLCANHMEPVKGFLGRYLRRKLVEAEVHMGTRNNDLNKIIDWIPKVWQHLNKFLETHSSSDVTIGPRLFLCCPMDISGSQAWFTDLWNYSIVPYLLEAVKGGLQSRKLNDNELYGRRAPWEDPAEWVNETYPWNTSGNHDAPSLQRLRPEDVGYDTQPAPPDSPKSKSENNTTNDGIESDALTNKLTKFQETTSPTSSKIPTILNNENDTSNQDNYSNNAPEYSNCSVESML
ncbi:neuron navigator 2-like isoform X5 [Octopus sinensis]|uniref:Neuron navigator 2-like isoform X5 n=1 Tax=Octopus sinensis TaxID=2607531 RepID=A0A7E6FJC3_9MOLL|nr:neuron navigator 2-like isoform X5 [Octopus sinensis]